VFSISYITHPFSFRNILRFLTWFKKRLRDFNIIFSLKITCFLCRPSFSFVSN
jgi:hypothetical protein